MIRILVVTDLRILRELLAHVLSERVEMTVVGTASNPASALAMLQDLEPSVALVSMRMAGSADLIREIVETNGKTNVVALGDTNQPGLHAVRDATVDDVIAALHRAVHRPVDGPTAGAAEADRWIQSSGLTHREQEIIHLIDQGLSNKEIARELYTAVSTVKNHVHNILEKLHVARRGQAAALMRAHRGPQRPERARQGATSPGRTI